MLRQAVTTYVSDIALVTIKEDYLCGVGSSMGGRSGLTY
ncbi:hypothetical protein Y11_02341 [Yersinia enterocolitica subsp. palearctica Y11]|uniref:Uncharacterized protein n=2 Tax=Yersinia enterocolitica TaxID=630 RepID=A0A0H3NS40_YERE1|nr:unknown protein [Yersinia enterocolitica W22703]CBY27947.1 hypothetical protein Y11_02341 [Yersinia enterocolitica subsp. palearctica Y11]CCO67456.1 hypothetical protein D322_560 [Yersinia enterocolitica IP 10393]